MSRLLKYFLRGLVVVAPVGITAYICVVIFETIDGWLRLPIRGVGFAITIILITIIGFLASSLITRGLLSALDALIQRLPFVRLLYGSSKDMLSAFVGEKRRFDKPVLVTLSADGMISAMGFLTAESMASLGIPDRVTVYIPQSYGFAGQMLVVRPEQVRRLDVDSADVMAYVLSGGVTQLDRGKTGQLKP
jgi:uncharacterized membrane protein